ncbi:MAG: hypothetical protein KF760_24500 [Candidatus Eremiobacteraeota bacterium]|nr:hypothetical protein [Candidatus Eremiobacteraeota bacterium]MCW5872313.1 hypothetical protein [Candidatus Eremiobacteraeota bacterium]
MSDLQIPRITAPSNPAAPVAIVKSAVDENGVKDQVVLTPAQLKAEGVALRNAGQAENAQAVAEEREADTHKAEAVKDKRDAECEAFQARKDLKSAEQAEGEQAAAAAEENKHLDKAQETRWAAEAKQAQADLEKQKAELLNSRAEELLASNELSEFNEGVYLLGLADSGFEAAHSLRDEALHLASNVQASLDLAKSAHATVVSKAKEATDYRASARQHEAGATEEAELSGRALEASQALKLDATERRKVAEKLLAESREDLQLAELGQKVQNGFLLH